MNILPQLGRRISLALISTCLLPLTGKAADDTAQIRSIVDAAIRPVLAEYDVPGMAVGVTVDGKAYFFNYGVAARDSEVPVSEATLFELGSVSKTFTATLASYAQVQGKLSLDDHPGKYMPQLKGSPIDQATLLNLGTYTAGGLPLQFPDELTNARMTSYFKHWKADAAPGARRRYSNPSIGLLGHVTALALKLDSADAVETLLLPQLGMKHTYVRVPASAMPNYAWGYNQDNKPVRVSRGVLDIEAYGVRSNSVDMIHYVQVNMAPGQLAQPMRRAVEGTHVGYFKTGPMVQGLGWEQYPYPVALADLVAGNSNDMSRNANPTTPLSAPQVPSAPTLYNKTGSTNGFGAYVAFVPEKKIGIVMLANRFYPNAARVTAAHAILEQLEPMVRR